jgi:starch synthase
VVDVDAAGREDAAATGFKFNPVTSDNLAGALRRASLAFHDKGPWRKLQINGMSTDVSWRDRASRYVALYGDVIAHRPE